MNKERTFKLSEVIKECFDNAQKAVANYTRKKVLQETEYLNIEGDLHVKCPTCDMSLPYLQYDYCPYCGQHLDWSDFIG